MIVKDNIILYISLAIDNSIQTWEEMENDFICPQCDSQFKQQNPPRLFVGCGHTFCQDCFRKMLVQKDGIFTITCPEDKQVVNLKNGDINNIPKNIALLKMLQSKKGNSSFKDPQLQMSKIVNTEQAHNDDQQARQIVAAIVLESSAGSQQKICFEKEDSTKLEIQEEPAAKPAIKEVKVQQKCKFHQKPLQVVCIIDLKRICVNCAIFGEHRGHQFKSLQEIENERVAYYSSILNIMDKKNSINERISSPQTCSSIMQILANKKQKMKNSITDKFKKLIEAIQFKQKQSLKSLDTMMQKTQAKLKNLMKIDPEILHKYDMWEQKSYEHIKILEGDDFQAKLHLLFQNGQSSQQGDVIDQGMLTIDAMNKQQQNLFTEVESTLENIGVEFNHQILNHIDGFVDIFDQVKKKKTKLRISKLLIQTSNLSSSPSQPNLFRTTNLPRAQKTTQLNQRPYTPTSASTSPKGNFPFLQINQIKKQEPKSQIIPNSEQSLLEVEEVTVPKKPQFIKTCQIPTHITQKPTGFESPKIAESPLRRQKMVVSPSTKFSMKAPVVTEQMSPRMSKIRKQDYQFPDKMQKPNKKKLMKLKLPEKYEKIVESLINDQLETVDLTNAQLGDNTITQISEFLLGSKVKAVKFIRNKLSDDCVSKLIPYLKGVITLNLSQNLLTDRVLDILIQNRSELELIKTVILSQNKINTRNAKIKLDKLKSLDIVVSL